MKRNLKSSLCLKARHGLFRDFSSEIFDIVLISLAIQRSNHISCLLNDKSQWMPVNSLLFSYHHQWCYSLRTITNQFPEGGFILLENSRKKVGSCHKFSVSFGSTTGLPSRSQIVVSELAPNLFDTFSTVVVTNSFVTLLLYFWWMAV